MSTPPSFLLLLALQNPFPAPEAGRPAPALAQGSDAPAGQVLAVTLPPGVAAKVNGKPITMEEYRDFLWTIHSKQQIKDLIAFKLLEEEAAKYGITVTDADIRAKIDKYWEETVTKRHGGDRAKAEKELRDLGFTAELYDRYQTFQTKKDLLQDRLVLRTRVVTDEAIDRRFDLKYGVDGVKVEVRQILLAKAFLRTEEIKKGGKKPNEVDPNLLEARAREEAFKAHERLKKGEEFAEVARTASHDPAAKQNGGVLANYNYERYGEEFAKVVRALKEGEISEPFPTAVGWHLVQVLKRTTTPLEKVRDLIAKELTEEPPSFAEKNEVYKRVFEAANVVLW